MRQQRELGRDAGQPVLVAPGPAPALGTGREVLPSLEEAADKPKPMWRHPAFIVSMILTVLALIAAAVLLIVSILSPDAGEVKRVLIAETGVGQGAQTGGNVHLSWEGNGPVELYVVTNSEPLDVTQFVTGDREAWLPAALNLYSRSSCFVVRPAAEAGEEVSIDGAVLERQKAVSVCMGDEGPEQEE